MAQKIEILWTALSLTHAYLLIFPAVFASLDGVSGFSTAVARVLKRPRAADLVLLICIVPASLMTIRGVAELIPAHMAGFQNFVRSEELRQFMAEQSRFWKHERAAEHFLQIVMWVQYCAAAVCLVWAIRLKRSVWVWVPLSILANLGGLFWLALRGRSSRHE